ncbi:MAG: glycosyltransferase, partial [Planctomycetaceae bacterium]
MTSNVPSVLIVSTTLNTGGAQRFVSTLLAHLDRSAVRPSLCLLRRDVGFPLADDVPLHVLDWQSPWGFPRMVRKLSRLIDEVKPDVLLSNITAANLVCGLALDRCSYQPRWIARIGNSPLRYGNPLRRLIAKRTYGRVAQFVVNSAGLTEDVVRLFPPSRGRIRVIANPTDFQAIDALADQPAEYQHSGNVPLLVAVGRLFEQKRYDVMLNAFAVARRNRPADLWICGEGPRRRSLERQIRRLGLGDSVRLLGYCSNPFALLRQATLFVMSSDFEGLPNSLIEAQGLGLPAVSTRCPWGPDEIIVDGVTGRLTNVDNAQALASAISELLDDPPRRQEMSLAAKQRARSLYDVARLTRTWEELITDVPGRERGGEGGMGRAAVLNFKGSRFQVEDS